MQWIIRLLLKNLNYRKHYLKIQMRRIPNDNYSNFERINIHFKDDLKNDDNPFIVQFEITVR